jgi:hypothetical protein
MFHRASNLSRIIADIPCATRPVISRACAQMTSVRLCIVGGFLHFMPVGVIVA